VDQRIRTKADAGLLPKGVALDLLPLLAAYGRDRRVAMRIERMPSRARLSRGRNNGDGSWSVTRDELDGLSYIPPKNAKEAPTLVVRIIGLESDNGATLAVLDYPVLDDDETERIESEAAATDSAQREAEFRQLRAELTKTKAALRANQTELSSARQLWEAELEERLADATNDSAATLDRNRVQWQTQAKERAAKLEARFAEQLAEAREALKRDDENERAKTETAWKEAEAARFAAAEAKWREQTARALAKENAERSRIEVSLSAARADAERNSANTNELRSLRDEVETLRTDVSDRDAKLAEAQSAAKKAHERARVVTERSSTDGSELRNLRDEVETLQANLSDRDARLAEAQSAAKEALERARVVAERGSTDGSELRSLRGEVETLRANLSDRDTRLAKAQSAAKEALERARAVAERGSADGGELRRLRDEVETLRANLSDRDAKLAEVQTVANEAQKRTRLATERGTADGSEIRSLRDEVETLRANLSDREAKLADAQAAAKAAHEGTRVAAQAVVTHAEQVWKAGEAARIARAEIKWQSQSALVLAEMAKRLESAEKALAGERKNKGARRPDGAELHELRNELAAAQAALKAREKQVAEAQNATAGTGKHLEQHSETTIAKAREEWRTEEESRLSAAKIQWQEQFARRAAELTTKLEVGERALNDARAEAKSAQERASQERRDTSETRRVKDALRQVQLSLEQRDAELAEAQGAAREAAERASNDVETALAKAEKEWEARETARFAEAKAQWQEQSSRVLKKARLKLEGAEAALAEARTQANSAHDLREGAELRRLRTEFAAARTKMTELETELAQAQVAAGRARERTREEVEAALAKAEEAWRTTEAVRISAIETQERERGGRALAEALSRLERTEAALKEARAQTEIVREQRAVSLAEAVTRYERTESQLREARTRIESMRDPANEAELGRLRQELGTIQIASSELEAEVGRSRAETRKARDRATEQSKAAVVRAQEAWRVEEAHRLAAARREWERDARSASGIDPSVEDPMEPVPMQRANRLLLDSMLAVCLAAAVVLVVTIWPEFYNVWPSTARASGSEIPKTITVVRPALPKPVTPAARASINVASANLRAEPGATAHLIARLRRGELVTPAERHGDWIHVHTDAAGGKPAQDGWIHYASLKMPHAP
jgi:hypothetical protein